MKLEQGRVLRLEDAAGVLIGCTGGVLWITEAGDPRDHLVIAGGRWRVCGPGVVVVEAMCESALWLCRPVRAQVVPPLLRRVTTSGGPS